MVYLICICFIFSVAAYKICGSAQEKYGEAEIYTRWQESK